MYILHVYLYIYINLGGGFKYFYVHPYLGKIPILTNSFQMGWNHQPVIYLHLCTCSFTVSYLYI